MSIRMKYENKCGPVRIEVCVAGLTSHKTYKETSVYARSLKLVRRLKMLYFSIVDNI